jgi:hypothetical protein
MKLQGLKMVLTGNRFLCPEAASSQTKLVCFRVMIFASPISRCSRSFAFTSSVHVMALVLYLGGVKIVEF